MRIFEQYIRDQRASGRRYFTTKQALSDLQISKDALRSGIYRLKKKGDLISPARGLYVFVAPEHRHIGCMPAEDLVPIMMQHWQADYYAGLLTAAMYHGSSHQKPQVFQVVTHKRLKTLIFGRVKIQFIYKKSLVGLPTQDINAKTGYLKISSPEVTVMDLFLYPQHTGGLSGIPTILAELMVAVDPDKLVAIAKSVQAKSWVQRLGYVLEHTDTMDNKRRDLAIENLQGYLKRQKVSYIPLAPELPVKGASRSNRWMIIENTTIEGGDDT